MRFFMLLLFVLSSSACVIEEDLDDDIRELIPTVKLATLRANGNGSGQLDFIFNYQLGMRDPEGIEQIDWYYRVMTKEQVVLSEVRQRMRKADPDKDEVLVQGDRNRTLPIDAGLEDGETYILWITIFYRGEIFEELLTGMEANGEPIVNDVDLPDLPPLP